MSVPYSLKNWKLTLPSLDLDNRKYAMEIKDAKEIKSILLDGATYLFRKPAHGALTPGAHETRCELRCLKEFSYLEKGRDRKAIIVEEAGFGNRLVIHQLHGGDSPIAKLCYTRIGEKAFITVWIRAIEGESDKEYQIIRSMPCIAAILSELAYFPATKNKPAYVRVTVNNAALRIAVFRTSPAMFFKAGAYGPGEAIVRHVISNKKEVS